jgi:hypothetical protein
MTGGINKINRIEHRVHRGKNKVLILNRESGIKGKEINRMISINRIEESKF